MVNEDSANNLRCCAEEMRTILPIYTLLIDESEVSLIYQNRCLKRVLRRLESHMVLSQPAKLVIDDWHQVIERSSITVVPCQQKFCNVRRIHL